MATFAEISACTPNSIGISFLWLRLHECRGTGASARFSEAGEIPREREFRSFRTVVTRCRRRPNRDCRCKARIDAGCAEAHFARTYQLGGMNAQTFACKLLWR